MELSVTKSPSKLPRLPPVVQKFQTNYKTVKPVNVYYPAHDKPIRAPSPIKKEPAHIDSILYRNQRCHNRIGPVQPP